VFPEEFINVGLIVFPGDKIGGVKVFCSTGSSITDSFEKKPGRA